jgi:type 1 fimbriae regulatory protein FimB/type 1 fimbriae regulatory protein FimE
MKKPAASKKRRQTPKTAKLAKITPSNPPPRRQYNRDVRTREYLTTHEIERLRKAARTHGRHGHRDDTLILLMFRHALRVSEVIALRWEQADLKQALLHVHRLKNGLPSTHPLRGSELRALRQLKREESDSPYVFVSERDAPLTTRTVHHMVARAGENANLPFTIHPHMLRHSTGFYLANHGHDTRAIQSYLGHANIKNTVMYTELSPTRFKNFWKD